MFNACGGCCRGVTWHVFDENQPAVCPKADVSRVREQISINRETSGDQYRRQVADAPCNAAFVMRHTQKAPVCRTLCCRHTHLPALNQKQDAIEKRSVIPQPPLLSEVVWSSRECALPQCACNMQPRATSLSMCLRCPKVARCQLPTRSHRSGGAEKR